MATRRLDAPLAIHAVPAGLRAHARWALWAAVWNAKRGAGGKWDKIPHSCVAPYRRISTTALPEWMPFERACEGHAASARSGRFAGLGYVMTGLHGVVGVDLDGCVTPPAADDLAGEPVLASWAREVVDALGSYAELSPSGTGVRIFCLGEIAADWTNHEVGIEVYAGHEARFLTVTGQRLPGTPEDLRAPGNPVLEQLAAQYARERSAPQAALITLELPELGAIEAPQWETLELPYAARDFLADGTSKGDRSAALFTAAVSLAKVGLGPQQVFAVLAHNPHALETALDHRRQDYDRALRYLWVEQAQKAHARTAGTALSMDDFEVVGPGLERSTANAPVDAPTGVPAAAAKPKAPRFAFQQAALFTQRPAPEPLIKGILPLADLGAVFGPSGAGKSFFVIDLCLAIARGHDWNGRRTRPGTVAYVCAEGAGGFTLRLKAYAAYHGVELEGVKLWVLGDQPNLLQVPDVRDLIAALKALPDLVLVVLDTLAQVTIGANENSAEDMGRALGHCRALKAATGALVLLVAHAGKETDRGLRGWSGIKGALDVEILIDRDGARRWATITKMKDGSGEGQVLPFQLNTQTLGEDADGEPVTSCVVQLTGPPGAPGAAPRAQPKGEVERLVLAKALDMLDLAGADNVSVHQLWEAAKSEMVVPAGERDRRRDVVRRAFEALCEKDFLATSGGFVKGGPQPT